MKGWGDVGGKQKEEGGCRINANATTDGCADTKLDRIRKERLTMKVWKSRRNSRKGD